MVPLVDAAAGAAAAAPAWKEAAFSQYPRPDRGLNPPLPDMPKFSNGESVMGYSVRTHTWRYSEWVVFDHETGLANWSAPLYGRELYSHEASPVPDASFDCENTNLAEAPEHSALVANLSAVLRAGWRKQLPRARNVDQPLSAEN